MALSLEVSGIATAKEFREPVPFLSEKAMEVLLRQPDDNTRIGLRDMCFMVTMYDTAARDCTDCLPFTFDRTPFELSFL